MKKHISHEHYKECLFNHKTFIHGKDVLRSIGHQVNGQHLNKVSSSPFDSKRFILAKGLTSWHMGVVYDGQKGHPKENLMYMMAYIRYKTLYLLSKNRLIAEAYASSVLEYQREIFRERFIVNNVS